MQRINYNRRIIIKGKLTIIEYEEENSFIEYQTYLV